MSSTYRAYSLQLNSAAYPVANQFINIIASMYVNKYNQKAAIRFHFSTAVILSFSWETSSVSSSLTLLSPQLSLLSEPVLLAPSEVVLPLIVLH